MNENENELLTPNSQLGQHKAEASDMRPAIDLVSGGEMGASEAEIENQAPDLLQTLTQLESYYFGLIKSQQALIKSLMARLSDKDSGLDGASQDRIGQELDRATKELLSFLELHRKIRQEIANMKSQ